MEAEGLREIWVPQDGRLNQFINKKVRCPLMSMCPVYGSVRWKVTLFLVVVTCLLSLDSPGGASTGEAESSW